jgi:hypothetical protein
MGAVTFSEIQQFSEQLQLKHDELYTILGFLNSIGALKVSRSSPLRTVRTLVWHAAHGVFYAPISNRRLATTTSIIQGCIRASLPFAIVSFVCAASLYSGGLLAWHDAGTFYSIFTATFVLSLALHEITHGLCARASKSQPVIIQAGMRLSLLHQPLGWSHEITSSIAGPLVGITACLGAALIWQQFINIFWQSCLLGMLSITHAGALLPQYGDGRSLITALKERRCSK